MVIQQIGPLSWGSVKFESVSALTARMINQYSTHNSFVTVTGPDADVRPNQESAFFHLHTPVAGWGEGDSEILSRSMIHFHNAPTTSCINAAIKFGRDRMAVPPQGAALRYAEYRGAWLLRNLVAIDDEILKPTPIPTDKIRLVLPCSYTGAKGKKWYKGYDEMCFVLQKIQKAYPTDFEFDAFVRIPRDECFQRVAAGNLVIVSVMNGTYGRMTHEIMATGRVVYQRLADDIRDLMLKVSKSRVNPIRSIQFADLESEMRRVIEKGPEKLAKEGQRNREWVEKYWHPRDVVRDYITVYERILRLPNVRCF